MSRFSRDKYSCPILRRVPVASATGKESTSRLSSPIKRYRLTAMICKKKKPPNRYRQGDGIYFEKPPTKKEKPLLAAPLAYGRLRRPPLSLLFSLPSAAAPPHTPSSRLSLASPLPPSYGGFAAHFLRPSLALSSALLLLLPRLLPSLLWAAAPSSLFSLLFLAAALRAAAPCDLLI